MLLKIKRRPKTVYCEITEVRSVPDQKRAFILKTKFEPFVASYTGKIKVKFYQGSLYRWPLWTQIMDVVAGQEFTLDGELTVIVGEV